MPDIDLREEQIREIESRLEEENADAILMPDLREALIGVTVNPMGNLVAVYDFQRCLQVRMNEGMSYDEAMDFHSYNTERALPYVDRAHRPIIIDPCVP